MNHLVLPLLRAIALVWLTLGMTVPVSAWTIHESAHGAAKVSVDTHHHHSDDGQISVDGHDDSDRQDGGHDHMPSILLGAAMVAESHVALAVPESGKQSFVPVSTSGLLRQASDGLRRPPKLG